MVTDLVNGRAWLVYIAETSTGTGLKVDYPTRKVSLINAAT